ncbi:MAG: hypothetical protein IJ666_06710 [Ruminococcus sp.]|nr:hypothetical protein [Ruminococcus sp.]
MGKKIKRFLLCLLAVSTLTMSGTVYADDNDEDTAAADTETEEESSGEDSEAPKEKASKIKESEEKVELTEKQAKALLEFIGSTDGFDIYKADKDYEDRIWESHGGKPEKKAELTEKQQKEKDAAEEEISIVKKLGEFVAVDPEKGKAAAVFDKGKKCDDGKIYLSDGGRYLLTTDKDGEKPLKITQVISTVDDPHVFRTADGREIELMDDDFKKVVRTYYNGGVFDGKRMYFAEDGENVVWLTEDGSQVLAVLRYGAENENMRMLIDNRHGIFGIENLETGYIWWSSPLGVTRDKIATPLLVDELRSSNILRYGIPEKYSNNNVLRSGTDDCEMKVSDIKNGIKIEYNYSKAGFKFPVEYTLEGDHLKASLRTDDIQETNPSNIATEITLMSSFGAASAEEDGYFVIPDGSGALVRFNNNRTMDTNAYTQRVYGDDVTSVPTSKGSVTEQIYLPVYGIVKEDNAMLVVASKGDSNAYLTAQVSGQSNSSYNLCSFTFMLRGTDTFYMSGNIGDKITVFERGEIKSDDIELLYYPISRENADYVDVAAKYREYLTLQAGVEKRTQQNKAPMYVDLYGGTEKKKPVLGIPVTMKQSVTKYGEAKEILGRLKDNGVDDMVVSYNNWTNDGIKNQIDKGAKASGTLGGKSDFRDLTNFMSENGIELYPVSDNRDFYSGNSYYSFSDTSVRISGAYSRIISYDRAYGIPDGFKKNMSLLSPDSFGDVFSAVSSNYSKAGLTGVSIGNLTTSLYGDYGKKNISRYDAMNLETEAYKNITDSLSDGMLADGANAYALPYVSHITNVPMTSSRFDLFNEDIPFYQIVVHGIIPYSTTAVNGDADSEKLLLMAAATGSSLNYDMLYEETSVLKDTEFDIYYYANYANWTDTAAAEYKLIQPVLENVSDSTITGYEVENDGKYITTSYSNGTVVKVDFEEKTIDFNGSLIKLSDYDNKGGVQF